MAMPMPKQLDDLVARSMFYAPRDIERLVEAENLRAWERPVNQFPARLTCDQEHYTTYTSLPYTVGLCKNRTSWLWRLDLKPEGPTAALEKRLCMPTGNLGARYMVVADNPVNAPPPKSWSPRLFFDRQLTRGAYAKIVRGAMRELQIGSETWYTSLVKLYTPNNRRATIDEIAAQADMLKREIEVIKPDFIILLGKPMYQNYRWFFPRSRDTKLVIATHPNSYAPYGVDEGAKRMANDLFEALF